MAAQYCGEGIVSVVVTILPHLAQSVLTLTLRKKKRGILDTENSRSQAEKLKGCFQGQGAARPTRGEQLALKTETTSNLL